MAGGANAGSFAAGFGKGLTNALMSNRERSDALAKEDRARKDKLFNEYVLPSAFKYLTENPDADSMALENLLAQQYPEQFGKSSKKKGGSPFETIQRFLGPMVGMHAKPTSQPVDQVSGGTFTGGHALPAEMPASIQPPGVSGGTINGVPPQALPQGLPQSIGAGPSPDAPPPTGSGLYDLPGMLAGSQDASVMRTPIGGGAADVSVAPGAAAGQPGQSATSARMRTFLGAPVPSQADQDAALVRRAVTLLPSLQKYDPTATLEDAFSILKTGQMVRDQRAASTSAASLFADQLTRRTTELKRPLTADEVAEERRKWEALNDPTRSMGTYVTQALNTLKLTAEEASRTGRMDEVNKLANDLAGGRAGSQAAARNAEALPTVTATGSGPQLVNRAAGTASPIIQGGAAGQPGVGQPIGPAPTAEMRNRDEARRLVIPAINEIEALGNKVITKVGPAQRADALKRGAAAVLGSDAEWRTYQDARTALAGNLAVLQQGSRPSDADIQAIWLPLVPDTFSDTTESAKMKWALIRRMSGLDPKTGQPMLRGGAGAGAASPNNNDAARRVRARQFLITAKKQTDDATIDTFLRNNPDFK